MKSIKLNKIADLEQLKDQPSYQIANNNWPQYSDRPSASFKAALHDDEICIEFTVDETNPRAVNEADQQPVWEDSCVEFFCSTGIDPHYINFEFNSRGVCVASRRLGRKEDVKPLTPEQLKQIKRTPCKNADSWTLTVQIPLSLIANGKDDEIKSLRANFYKCGDKTDAPHYLSWSPIALPSPDFHCPAFFGEIIL